MKWITIVVKRIYAYSDTHGKHHILPAHADVIICAGDMGLYTEEDAAAYNEEIERMSIAPSSSSFQGIMTFSLI